MRLIVHLYGKQGGSSQRRGNIPVPRGPQDSEFYKIVVNSSTSQHLGELMLSVQACNVLLKLDSE